MKKIFVIIFGVILLFNCKTENPQSDNNHSDHKPENQTIQLISVDYSVNPETIKAGEPAELFFEVKNSSGETIKELEIVHEKPMHLIIVSEDLKEFYHLHPELQSNGAFKTTFTFPTGGYYRIYADVTPKGATQIVKNFTQAVVGTERPKEPLKADVNFEKTIDGLRFVMKTEAALESGKDVVLNFQVFDAATDQPVTDLEKYLGEYAHFVIISEDLSDYVHVHPESRDNVKSEEHSHDSQANHDVESKLANQKGESIVAAFVTFPNAGKYKIWAQFQRGGKITTLPFVVEVKQGKAEKTLAEVKIPEGAFKILVSKDGFTPQEVSFKKGQPLKLAFIRIDEENCGDEVVFKDLNIRKKLPVGEVVMIDIPTDKTGEMSFSCGMDMLKGKIIIQ